MSIAFKEGLKIPPPALNEVILASNQDIRQVLINKLVVFYHWFSVFNSATKLLFLFLRYCIIWACGLLKTKSWPMTRPKLMLKMLRRTWNWYVHAVKHIIQYTHTLYNYWCIDDVSGLYSMNICVFTYAGSIWCVSEGVCFRRGNRPHVFDWQIRPFLQWLLFSTTICSRKLPACPTGCCRVGFRLAPIFTMFNTYLNILAFALI